MADRGAEATAFSGIIEFEAFRRSVGMGTLYRGLETDFQRAKSVTLNQIANDGIVVDAPADQEALEAAPAFTTATMSNTQFDRALIRGRSQSNMLHAMEGPGPARLDQNLMQRLATKLAIQLDTNVFAAYVGATFGTAAGNGFELATVGAQFTGTNAYGISRSTGLYAEKGTPQRSEEQFYKDLLALPGTLEFTWRDRDLMGGELIGEAGPTGFAFFAPPVVIRAIVTAAAREGVLDMPQSVGTQAVRGSGILGQSAYQGRVHNVDLVSTTALRPGSAATHTFGYAVPIGASGIGGIRPMMWDFARYGQGNTGGAAVSRTTVIWPYFVGLHGQEHLGRVRFELAA